MYEIKLDIRGETVKNYWGEKFTCGGSRNNFGRDSYKLKIKSNKKT